MAMNINFDRILKFFKKTQDISESRYKDFEGFYRETIMTFPVSLKIALRKRASIRPCVPLFPEDPNVERNKWFLGFDAKDLLWWKSKWETERMLFKSTDEIKRDVMQECLDIIDSMQISEMTADIKELYSEILSEITADDDTE